MSVSGNGVVCKRKAAPLEKGAAFRFSLYRSGDWGGESSRFGTGTLEAGCFRIVTRLDAIVKIPRPGEISLPAVASKAMK